LTLIQSLILGIIQGLTEFLPISSSAHLVLIPHLLGWQIPESQVFPFDVLVQLGTLAAVIIYFWKDLLVIVKAFFKALVNRQPFANEDARLGWYLILATIPAVIAGVLIKDKVEAAFNSVNATALFLFGTALLLILAEVIGKHSRGFKEINWLDAVVIGLFQAIALFPGISRSGSTISGGMFRKLDRRSAARFSFLMSIPVMIGAGLVSFKDAIQMPDFSAFLPILIVGVLAALLVGYLSIHWLLNFLNRKPLYVFAIYCILLGSLVLGLGLINKNAKAVNTLAPVESATAVSPLQTLSPVSAAVADPAQNPLTVAYSSSISWIVPVMGVCADSIHGLSLITHPYPDSEVNSSNEKILISWGVPETLPPLAYELGSEDLTVIVNSSNKLTKLTFELVSKIYSGQIGTWGEIFNQCPECFSASPTEELLSLKINRFSYSNKQEPQILLLKNFLGNQPDISSPGILVSSSAAMVSGVEKDPTAIGFVGSRSIDEKVKRISISGVSPSSHISSPILAILDVEPNDTTQTWISCLQKVINP
jgi:undecaprenyl-diphosphatase